MSDDMQSELFDAIERHDTDAVLHLLRHGASASGARSEGSRWSPLHAATGELADGGPISIVHVLLEHRADVNALDGSGNNALLIAAQNADWQGVLTLLAAGGDPSIRNIDNDSPISLAVEGENLAVIRKMLETGLCKDLDSWIGFTGLTMLGHAAKRLDIETIQILLSAGADIETLDDQHRKAIQHLPPETDANSAAWHLAADLLSGNRP